MTNIIGLNGKPVEPEKTEDAVKQGDAISAAVRDFVVAYDIPDDELMFMGRDKTGILRFMLASSPDKVVTTADQFYRLSTMKYMLEQIMESMIHNPQTG